MSYEELVESKKIIGDMTKEELFIYCQGLLEEVWSFENESIKLHSIIKEVREYGKEVLSWTTNEPITDEIGEHILEIVEKEEVPYNTDEEQQDYLWEQIDEDNIELGE